MEEDHSCVKCGSECDCGEFPDDCARCSDCLDIEEEESEER